MTINDIIQDKYIYLLNSCSRTTDRSFPLSKTKEDVLNDVCLTALKKYKDKDIDFQEGFEYLQKSFYTEIKYSSVRFDPLTTVENYNEDLIEDYD